MSTGASSFPPIVPQPVVGDSRDAAWPGWIGGLSIAFAGLTLLGACCGSATLLSVKLFGGMAGMEFPSPPRLLVGMTVLGGVVAVVMAVMLMIGGIGTLRRRPTGPRLLVRYAAISLVLALVQLPLTLMSIRPSAEWGSAIAHAQFDALEKNGTQVTDAQRAEADAQAEPTAVNYVMSVGGTLIGCVYPAVLLVFLRRPRVRAQWEAWAG
jgi:hypothetical protein